MIVAFTHLKGGVGKTTSAVNLAAALARSQLRVLLLDLDPQSSAGYSLGVPNRVEGASLADVLLESLPLEQALWETPAAPGLDIAVGGTRLASLELELAAEPGARGRLAGSLEDVRKRYDFIVIDAPPGLSLLALLALDAADAFITPTTPHGLAYEALDTFFTALAGVRPAPRAKLLGVLITMVDHRTRLTERACQEIRRRFGADVFRVEIPINVRLAEAPEAGRSIFNYEGWSTGAQAYSRFGAEVLRRARRRELV